MIQLTSEELRETIIGCLLLGTLIFTVLWRLNPNNKAYEPTTAVLGAITAALGFWQLSLALAIAIPLVILVAVVLHLSRRNASAVNGQLNNEAVSQAHSPGSVARDIRSGGRVTIEDATGKGAIGERIEAVSDVAVRTRTRSPDSTPNK